VSDVLFIHAGVADSRMWRRQLETFPNARAVDLPGFGTTPIESEPIDFLAAVRDALDETERAALVGTSGGARVALEFALESPERVSALVLVSPGLDGHDWSEDVRSFWAEEEAALERGDLEAAVEVSLRLWLAGPRRSLDAVDPAVRELAAEMQRDAFRLQEGHEMRIAELDPPASQRLSDVRAPTLVVTGDEDVHDIHEIADKLTAEIPGAERATIPHAAHLPNLERPEEFDRIVLEFSRRHDG
jgi:pimeloyl-ACP methyl ester carboxylesterase